MLRPSPLRVLVAAVAIALLVPWRAAPVDPRPLGGRLLGPVASLVAGSEWVRFEQAWREGEPGRAAVHAERALELDPRAPEGWIRLGEHFVFERASPVNEPDPAERVRWIRTGLDVWQRGEASTDDPGALLMIRGTTLVGIVAPLAATGELPWPGGEQAAREEARAALIEAVAHGTRNAHTILASLRRSAERGVGMPTDDQD